MADSLGAQVMTVSFNDMMLAPSIDSLVAKIDNIKYGISRINFR